MFNLFVVCASPLTVPPPTFPLELSDLDSSLVFFLYTSKTFLGLCFRVVPHPQCCLLFVEEGLVVGVTVHHFNAVLHANHSVPRVSQSSPGPPWRSLRRSLPHCLHCDWLLLIEVFYLRQNYSFSVLHLSPLQCPTCLCGSPHIWLHLPSPHQLD